MIGENKSCCKDKKVFIKVVGGDVRYCLGDDVEVGASGNHHPTFPQILLPTMSLSTLATSLVTYSSSLKTLWSSTLSIYMFITT